MKNTNSAAMRRRISKPTRAELEAKRLRDLVRLERAWRLLTREVRA